jgi:hypothetical protein
MEEQEDGWLTVLEKNGLGPAAAILENYGIDSETDLLVLDQDDFSQLASRGLKPLHVKKLERWCETVRVWYLYEIALWFHGGNLLRHTFRNH